MAIQVDRKAARRRDMPAAGDGRPRWSAATWRPAFLARQPQSYAQRRATFDSPFKFAFLVLLVIICLALPRLVSVFYIDVAAVILLAVPGAVALNAVQGVAGQVSAGNAALMAVGAYTAAFMLTVAPGTPFLVVLVLAGISGGLVGALIAIPALRAQGLYLLIATLALQFIVSYLTQVYQTHAVGDQGFTFVAPKIGPLLIVTPEQWYYVLLIAAIVAIIVLKNWLSSRVGRGWLAVHNNPAMGSILGINVGRAKMAVFVASSVMIGIQGAIFAYYVGVVQYSNFSFDLAIQYVAMVIIGGYGSVVGIVFGVLFVEGMPYFLQYLGNNIPSWFPAQALFQQHIFDLQDVVYGLFIIIFLMYAPGGLVELWERLTRRVRLWPLRRELPIDYAQLAERRPSGTKA
jgi:branched-chain amino acid transport system permease protein